MDNENIPFSIAILIYPWLDSPLVKQVEQVCSSKHIHILIWVIGDS